jgi:DNA-binding transcriptional LysR family regulator
MKRQDTNRAGEMDIFVRVVDTGGFAPAARDAGMTPSAVSKLITRLEQRLGTRLLNRTTRQLQLTPEGTAFHERCIRILADIADAEQAASIGSQPRGRVRISVNVPMGRRFLLPLVPHFAEQHPNIMLDIVLTDMVIDLLEDRTDIAIRHGPMASSRLMARKLGETQMIIVAAPAYLARHGVPESCDDLARHLRIGFNYRRLHDGWPVLAKDAPVPPVSMSASDGDTVLDLTLAGFGLGHLAGFQTRRHIESGRLVPVVLSDACALPPIPTHAVYLGHGGALPARIRTVLDFLKAHMRISDELAGNT